MRKPISQREARRLRKRVSELQRLISDRSNTWSAQYPGGTNIATTKPGGETLTAIKTARKLGYAIVVTASDDTFYYYAVKD